MSQGKYDVILDTLPQRNPPGGPVPAGGGWVSAGGVRPGAAAAFCDSFRMLAVNDIIHCKKDQRTDRDGPRPPDQPLSL